MNGVHVIKIKPCFERPTHSITEILNGLSVTNIKMLKVKGGTRLGPHYHHYVEACYIVSGKLLYTLNHLGQPPEQFVLKPGDLLIKSPLINHVGEFLEDSEVWDFSCAPFVSSGFNNIQEVDKWPYAAQDSTETPKGQVIC